VFIGFVHEEHSVTINEEHSEYLWFTFEEAKEVVSLPSNKEVLQSIENNFIKKKPLSYLKI
jgi:dihydroneopterin triphosphate diphosphatase